MTVQTTLSKHQYAGDGSTVIFNFSFPIYAESDLRVVLRDANDDDTVQVLTTDYTVSAGPWPAGGSITMTTAPASTETLTLKSDIAPTQGVDYTEAGLFPAESTEDALDRLTLLVQQLEEELSRSLRLQESTAISAFILPDPTSNQVPVWDGSQFNWVTLSDIDPTAVTVSSWALTLLDDASAAAALTTLGVTAFAQTLLDDATAAAALTTLGVTSFAQTVLDDADAATARATLEVPQQSNGNILCPHEDLKVIRQSATTVDADADAVLLTDASGNQKRFTSLNVTLDIAGTGGAALGLDTGSEANSTWYYIWAIGKADGTVSAIFSASSSAPTLPGDYVYYGLISTIYNDASGHLTVQLQRGNRIFIDEVNLLSADSAASVTLVPGLSAVVPPEATEIVCMAGIARASGSAGVTMSLYADSGGVIRTAAVASEASSSTGTQRATVNAPIYTAQSVWYAGAGTGARSSLDAFGYVL